MNSKSDSNYLLVKFSQWKLNFDSRIEKNLESLVKVKGCDTKENKSRVSNQCPRDSCTHTSIGKIDWSTWFVYILIISYDTECMHAFFSVGFFANKKKRKKTQRNVRS
ncbi:uncharacterized protein LOC127283610 [Leptopilina boulardi]|uniref:uncharacterized protein LOC127283610 n=1 Tax=Leptopilina boulardi TaxID=63433 RepID=UPI0021F55D96|nr:uncharacterized protein LOC127283610 [Leptopilina boulardi]XP_051164559.1 uncharacterized protein LOC127283610 [Leptopilina boulardi]